MIDLRTIPDARLDDYYKILSDEERTLLDSYRQADTRRNQLITRAAVRICLSQYSDSVPPHKWEIEIPYSGKPQLRQPAPLPLAFNLSHSGYWLAIVITVEKAIGVDVQHHSTHHSLLELARRFFHPDEVADVEAREGQDQEELFFRLWTLKEAYLKARGTGIVGGLDKVCFRIDNNGMIAAAMDSALDDNGREWQFHHYHIGVDYCLSLAMKQPRVQSASPKFYKIIPKELVEPLDLQAHQIRVH